MGRPGFWNDQAGARTVTESLSRIRETVEAWERLKAELEDLGVLFELVREEGDDASASGLLNDLDRVEGEYRKLELESILGDPRDRAGAIMMIHAGAGGTEACDWVAMLLRMYRRWA